MLAIGEVIAYLNRASLNGTLTVKGVAAHFKVTDRTIQTHIKNLQKQYPDYLSVNRGKIVVHKNIPLDPSHLIPASFQERKAYILRNLLTTGAAIDLDELAAQLCISEVTLQNEIKAVRRSLHKCNLTLRTKNNKLFIEGDSRDKKALIIKLIYDEAQNSLVSLATLGELFPRYDVALIRTKILENLDKRQFYMDEYSLVNLLLHILIAMDQAEALQAQPDAAPPQDFFDLNRHFAAMVEEMCAGLEELYHLHFTPGNKYQFTLLLMTRAVKNRELSPQDTSRLTAPDDGIRRLVEDIVRAVYENFSVDLNNIEFLLAFSLHIKNMLIRLRQNVAVHNPLLYNIKSNSPMIYDIAVYICNIIAKHEHVQVYDDEIAYIALHIGARIEEINGKRGKLQAALVCPQYYSYPHKQFEKIEMCFIDDLILESICTNPGELRPADFDLIITTVLLPGCPNQVLISNFFNDRDRSNLAVAIEEIKSKRAREKTMAALHRLIRKDLFLTDAVFASRQEALRTMSDRLVQAGVVGEDFLDRLLERENISPTNFGQIAIPHPIDACARQSVIEVALLRDALPWGSSQVQMIFLFSVSKSDMKDFSDIFAYLARVCGVPENIRRLAEARNYEDFLKTLQNLNP